jgi:hypothetical protein
LIAHVILFRPKAHLTDAERGGLFDAMRTAHREIPGIRRFVIGRRITSGRPYEALARDFPFFALLEFASKTDLDTYLTHPAHDELGDRFYLTSDAAEAYDFVLSDVAEGFVGLRGLDIA